ncbi:major facilitator superfamily domain-containing protein [Lasiosphaeria hispida]|uniref:Major facilitator superfamily domain-containing protein n=1 Tax=Lasiosphaeria hispida TaxID=260671 RepID=A0AAJ0M847_9PEZI|nr:major facilitator superfamily domain-containing protein [Lasiosphaeria hispida]
MSVSKGETQPLLGSRATFSAISTINTAGGPRATDETDGRIVNGCVVDFDPNGDVDNPLEWPIAYKWGIVALMALMAFTVTFTCISVVPLAADIGRDLSGSDHTSKSASVLLVTIWELGEAAGPLLIAPLSEIFGRYPVTNGANMLFVVATVMAATSQSVPVFVTARALTGLAVASNVLNPAIVGDMFPTEQRGGALSLVFLAPLIGGALGPAIASAVAEKAGWRRVIWMSAALVSVCEVLFLTLFRETYKVAILRRRAKALGVKTALEGEVDEKKGLRGLRDAMLRPAIVLFGSGVLAAMSLFGSICFSFYYIMSVTLSDVLREVYHLSPVAAGLCFMSFSFGSTFTVFVCNTYLDKIYIKLAETKKGAGLPEYRLPLAIVGALTMPLATLAYGWVAELRLGLPFMLLSISMLGTTLMFSMIPLMSYVVDAFGLFSASAMTGVIVMRCLAGTFLPLTTGPLIDFFGYGWGFTVFAGMALSIAPIPIVIFRYGEKWRQYSKYSRA